MNVYYSSDMCDAKEIRLGYVVLCFALEKGSRMKTLGISPFNSADFREVVYIKQIVSLMSFLLS